MYIFEQTLPCAWFGPLSALAGNDPWLTDQLSQMGIGLRELGELRDAGSPPLPDAACWSKPCSVTASPAWVCERGLRLSGG